MSIRVGVSLGHIGLVAVWVSISFGQSQYGFSLFGSLWVSFSLGQYQFGSVSIRVGVSLGHIWLVAVGVSISFGQICYRPGSKHITTCSQTRFLLLLFCLFVFPKCFIQILWSDRCVMLDGMVVLVVCVLTNSSFSFTVL